METWLYDTPLVVLMNRAERDENNKYECEVEKPPRRYKVTIELVK